MEGYNIAFYSESIFGWKKKLPSFRWNIHNFVHVGMCLNPVTVGESSKRVFHLHYPLWSYRQDPMCIPFSCSTCEVYWKQIALNWTVVQRLDCLAWHSHGKIQPFFTVFTRKYMVIVHGYVSCTGWYLARTCSHPDDCGKLWALKLSLYRHPVIPPEVRCLDGMFLGSKYRASGGGFGCLQPLRCHFIALKEPSIQSLPCSMANMRENTCEVGEKRIPKPPQKKDKKQRSVKYGVRLRYTVVKVDGATPLPSSVAICKGPW